jgi:hypothetical protein
MTVRHYPIPSSWRPPPLLAPWQRTILRLVLAHPGATTQEIGDRYYPVGNPSEREKVANHELRILDRAALVQRHRGTWSPCLMTAEVLRRASAPP